MDVIELLIVAAVFFLAAFVKGATGMGFSTTALPMLAVTIGLKEALPLLIIPSLCSNLFVMIKAGGLRKVLIRFRIMFAATLIGVVFGVLILNRLDGAQAGMALGIVLLVWCGFTALHPGFHLPPRLAQPLAPVSGMLTGLTNGVTGSQVMPLLPFLMAQKLPRGELVQASNISFSLSSLAMAAGLTTIGLMTLESVLISVLGLLPVALGVSLGTRVGQALSNRAFTTAVLVVLAISGVTLILRPFVTV